MGDHDTPEKWIATARQSLLSANVDRAAIDDAYWWAMTRMFVTTFVGRFPNYDEQHPSPFGQDHGSTTHAKLRKLCAWISDGAPGEDPDYLSPYLLRANIKTKLRELGLWVDP